MRKKMVKSLALATALTMCGFGAANAAVDLNASPVVPLKYASELAVAAAGTTLGVNGVQDVKVKVGASIANTEVVYIRLDLPDGAKFTGAVAGVSASGNLTIIAHAGGTGTSVTLKGTAGAIILEGDVLTFSMSAGIDVFDQGLQGIKYTLYGTSPDALAQVNPIATASGSYVSFATGVTSKMTKVTPDDIDLSQSSTYFDGGDLDKVTVIGNVTVGIDGTVLAQTGAAINMGNLFGADTKLDITGDFSASQNFTGTTPDGTYTGAALNRVYLAKDSACALVTAATALTEASASFKTGATALASGTNNFVCMEVNGVNVISPGSYSAAYDAEAASVTYAPADIAFGTVGTIVKNGSANTVPFSLTPGGAFPNMNRITNTSNVDGIVYVTMTNDEGVSVRFDLDTVEGGVSGLVDGKLPAGASTSLISIDDLYAAAQVEDTTFETAGNSNKLRLVIEGEFTSIQVNTFTIASDGTSFGMMQ